MDIHEAIKYLNKYHKITVKKRGLDYLITNAQGVSIEVS